MPNRNLTSDELKLANALLADLRKRMQELSGGDERLLFAYRRKLYKELSYDERGKPAHRNKLKAFKRGQQGGVCTICSKPLPEKNVVLDRLDATTGYTSDNTRLIHEDCDREHQASRGYA